MVGLGCFGLAGRARGSLVRVAGFHRHALATASLSRGQRRLLSSSTPPDAETNARASKPLSRVAIGNTQRVTKQGGQMPARTVWRSLLIMIIGGGGIAYFFQREKKRLEIRRQEKERQGIGKPLIGGPFKLTDMNGSTFTDKDLLGKFSILYFGFTMCPDVCPEELEVLAYVLKETNKDPAHKKIQPIFVTCDPARDTPEVLKEYLADFHPDIIGLTGTYQQIKDICKKYRVYFSTPPNVKPGQSYLVDHSIFFYMMDPEGKFIDVIGRNYDGPEALAKVAEHLDAWRPSNAEALPCDKIVHLRTQMAKRAAEKETSHSKVKKLSVPGDSELASASLDAGGQSACFRRVSVRMHVFIAPEYVNKPLDGIREQHLDPLLLRYFDAVRGVVVAYNNLKVYRKKGSETALGAIIGECPFSFTWISTDLLVWSPSKGDVIEGYVTVQSPSHIALLIHDTFNATVKYSDIPPSWTFVPIEDDEAEGTTLGHWQDKDGQRVEGKMTFTVKKFITSSRTVLVLGSLISGDDEDLPQMEQKPQSRPKSGVHQKFEEQAENVIETGNSEPEKGDEAEASNQDASSEDEASSSDSDSSSASSDSGSNEDTS